MHFKANVTSRIVKMYFAVSVESPALASRMYVRCCEKQLGLFFFKI